MQGSLASLGQAPGIAPPAYAYLDNASVALYLGQLQGGISKSEQLTQQLTQGRNASLSAGGVSLGGSTGSSSSAERVVTPTATARFYQLLDLLDRDGYLITINAAASPAKLRREFAGVDEGLFVQLYNCRLRLPSYVQLGQLVQSKPGSVDFLGAVNQYANAGQQSPIAVSAVQTAQQLAGQIKYGDEQVGPATKESAPRLARAIHNLGRFVSRNPRIPLSTCDGKADYRPHGVDLLFPIRLANLSGEQSLLAGPVTVVGKLVRAVRRRGDEYLDNAAYAALLGPVTSVDESAVTHSPLEVGPAVAFAHHLSDELMADAVVLAPGAVILPVAIYK